MGGFTNPPPSGDLSGSPPITVPDFVAQAKQTAEGFKDAGLFGDLVARFYAYAVKGWHIIISTIISVMDGFISDVVSFFSSAQGTNTPGFFALIGSLLEDLLGVPVDASALDATFHNRGAQASLRAVGGVFFDSLTGMLQQGGGMSPDSGVAAAKAWLGFLTEFAVRQGNISFVQSLLPAEWLEGIRVYGEMLEKNYGLGRLSRQAFQPLMKILIADPLTWGLNQKYTPTLLGASSAVKALTRGIIDQNTFDTEMAYAGYSPDRIRALELENLPQLPAADIWTLFRWQQIDQPTADALFKAAGYPPDTAKKLAQAQNAREADADVTQFITVALGQYMNGYIDGPAFEGIIEGLPIGDARLTWLKHLVGQKAEYPSRRLTFAEVQAAVVSGFMTLQDLDDFLKLQRYDPISHNVLVLQTLEKFAIENVKEAVELYKYNLAVAKAKKKGEPPPPPPPGVAAGT